MNRRRAIQVLAAFSAGLLETRGEAQRASPPHNRLPLPLVQPPPGPPGAVQPMAPGERPAPRLPQLSLPVAVPGLQKVEFASNGRIRAAHAVVLVEAPDATLARRLSLAQAAVQGSFAARPELADVTVSVYRKAGYAGFGGPPPLLTASVPRDAQTAFFKLDVRAARGAARVWVNDDDHPPAPTRMPSRELERTPVFVGSPAGLTRQRVLQLAAQLLGGPRGGLFFHGPSLSARASLSFDDAPHPIFAPLLLDTLRRERVRATFFCIGRNAHAYPYFVMDMIADGHEVGNHTYHHLRLTDLPASEVADELSRCNAVLADITGQPVRYFRPPGGRYSPSTLQLAQDAGLITTFWTDDPADFDNVGQRLLTSRLDQHLRCGGIVLLHDNVLQSVVVLPRFLAYARQQGVMLTTVGALAGT